MELPEGAQWARVQGTIAGTTTLKTGKSALYTVLIGTNQTGTVTFYDDTTGTTTFFASVVNTTGTQPTSLAIGARLRKGLTVVKGGTVDMTVMYQ